MNRLLNVLLPIANVTHSLVSIFKCTYHGMDNKLAYSFIFCIPF